MELATLASEAASVVVKALATTAWETTKSGVAALWRRVHPDRVETIQAELEETRSEVLEARKTDDGGSEQNLVGEWAGRLRRLLAADPDVAADLRRLMEEVLLPALAKAGSSSTSISMQATAMNSGRVNQAGRDQHITQR